ncbi:Abortive infection protein [Beutenbergia cavernae DSM 12333]|uniref:Abortive infection protein n=1 Tax=Beutenbergia cavernae (strain ATCC BAA-8 / DSM 12333 / CCUG 43141 / JCM 11478 / NBRC 16432 / NCIMB 13614 / HKI 0122) TaxID=471853 RepID=C5C0E3_BEUC1|nr:CPBP family glutamic-type intramembrane protease [Beutenbergia cavernae]ACQ79329.1 Abortive infection protein [Beutenbergia cavernae DSM 12333]
MDVATRPTFRALLITRPTDPAPSWGLVPAILVSGAAILLFGVHLRPLGYVPLVLGVALGFVLDRSLGRSLFLVALGQAIISTISLEADLSDAGMVRFAVVLSLAVAVPFAISRWVFHDDVIRFPFRTREPWSRVAWTYLIAVVGLGYLILPWYFITSGAYANWPAVETGGEIARLFVGVNAVGIWDELFFVCTVFALYRRHFPLWQANLLQAAVFVSFLWELGYRSWGPLLTIPFALVQGLTFALTKSLTYVLCVHLLFDLVVFGVIVHAHNPELFDIFLVSTR